MRFDNLSIGKRLTIGLASLLSLCLFSSLLGIAQLWRLDNVVEDMLNETVQTEQAANDMNLILAVAIMRTTAVARSNDDSLVGFFAPTMAESSKRGGEILKRLEARLKSPEELELLAKVKQGRSAYYSTRDKVMALKKAGNGEASQRALEGEYLPAAQSYQALMQATVDLERQQIKASGVRIAAIRERSTLLLAAACMVSLALGTLLAWKLTTSITRPLRRAQVMARRISEMDLSEPEGGRTAPAGQDETGHLLRSLEGMRAMLARTVAQVRASTDTIRVASSEVAVGSQDLSQRTEQTAASLQQAAASMNALSGNINESTTSARRANDLASSAADTAVKGSEAVSHVVATMDDINAASKRISDILGVIDGIAFQTNILALNAAVEAARAGEQGRGFAVVASEVRALAGRSATAAKEIKGLIGDSVKRIDAGSRLVADAGTTMKEIEGSIKRVAAIIGEVTAASTAQCDGIGQVHSAVSQLDQMTQQNAALVEESTAASESLRSQAATLAELVAQFRLDPVGG